MPRQNPFDSDDESPCSARASVPSALAYSNPFDDEEKDEAVVSHTSGTNIPMSKNSRLPFHSKRNPFDDDDVDDDEEEEHVTHGFDPDEELPKEKPIFKGAARGSVFPIKMKVSSSGQSSSIVKKAQMIKETGMKHASRFVEGSREQAQRIKESASKAFESRENNRKDQVTHESDHQNYPKDTRNSQSDHESQQKDHKKHGKDHGNNLNYDNENNHQDNEMRYDRDELFTHVKSSPYNGSTANMSRTRFDEGKFRKQELEYRTLEELEGCAIQKSEDTTSTLQNCLKVAEEMRDDATKTLLALHSQGEQLKKTHEVAAEMDQNLKLGEKALGNLGGIFSRKWKPRKSQPLTGPVIVENDPAKRRGHHLEQRVALGIDRSKTKDQTNIVSLNSSGQQTTHEKLEIERAKQDNALADLSDMLDSLKGMSIDMGLEISSQVDSMDQLEKDTMILNDRVKDANHRGRRLLGR